MQCFQNKSYLCKIKNQNPFLQMKKVLFSIAILAISTGAFAQDADVAFTKGSSNVSLGYGFLSPYKTLFKLSSFFGGSGVAEKFTSTGPIGLTYEYGISEKVGIGLQLGYATMKNTQTEANGLGAGKDYVISQKLTQFSAIARGNYHFGNSAKFDPYVGAGLGYGNFKYTVKDNDTDPTDVLPSISIPGAFGITGQLGARYYFTSNIGAFAEIGYLAGSFAQLGLTAKF